MSDKVASDQLPERMKLGSFPPSNRDWIEDFPHENGRYENKCSECSKMFYGHKRRTCCKQCYNSTAHTPAPWLVSEGKYCPMYTCNTYQVYTDDDSICEVFGSQTNARLIAAAPEMLEALKEIVANCGAATGDGKDDLTFIKREALEAIAKAEGKEGK